MPIYEYEHVDGACGAENQPNRFELLERISAPATAECPQCGKAVHRLISVPGRPQTNIMAPSNLAEKGFTQFTRRDKGVYEKTAGAGPSRIEMQD